MAAKTSQTSKTKRKTPSKKKPSLSFTRKELFLWLGVIFLSMVWMFILGIIVGRGLSPVRFDVEELKEELVALKQEAIKAKEKAIQPEEEADERHLGFYDILTEKKEMARLKALENVESGAGQEDTISTGPEASDRKASQKKSPAKQSDREATPTRQVVEASSPARYTLQIASFRDTTRAKAFISTLETKGYDAYQVAAHVDGKGIYHRVRIGHFPNKQAARKLLARLKQDNLNPLLIQK